MIFIMGFSGSLEMWPDKVIEPLAEHNRVILFDNRGMGRSTAGDAEFSMDLFVADTIGLMNRLKIERAHILAWSMGTNIALQTALDHPDRIDRLLLCSADCGGDEALMSMEVRNTLSDQSGSPGERGRRVLELMFPEEWRIENPDIWKYFPRVRYQTNPENVMKQLKAMLEWKGAFSRLKEIKSPTLLLTGTEDMITPPENSFIIGRQIPGAWVVQTGKAGHGLMYQYPEQFCGQILNFLENN